MLPSDVSISTTGFGPSGFISFLDSKGEIVRVLIKPENVRIYRLSAIIASYLEYERRFCLMNDD
jgi:hypothetical protein